MDEERFVGELSEIGIFGDAEQQRLLGISKRCIGLGVAMGAGLGTLGAGAGSVAVPGFGAVPAAAVTFLAGLLIGTVSCHYAVDYPLKETLRELARP